MNILQVSTSDSSGGAQGIALQLHRAYLAAGHDSHLAVGRKTSVDPRILQTPRVDAGAWNRACTGAAAKLSPYIGAVRGTRRVVNLLNQLSHPRHVLPRWQGLETFEYAGEKTVADLLAQRPDVIHCHNLHGAELPGGGYFDLQSLPAMSQFSAAVLTLHDAWLLSGHCAHSLGCDRWRTGCGQCPDLGLYPAIRRDATAANWERKRSVFARSRLFVATPSRWLMNKVEESMLWPAVAGARVIPNGVDLSIFHPGDRAQARHRCKLSATASIVLFAANAIRHNAYKDFATMRAAIARVAPVAGQPLEFIALGESGPDEQIGSATIRFVPHQSDPRIVADYFRAADVYVHAALADTFPSSVLEALACGLPVVATAVGGIPEQVNAVDASDAPTGFLTPAGDADAMARAIHRVLSDEAFRQRLSRNAAADAAARFDFRTTADAYLAWYEEILATTTTQEPTETVHAAEGDHVYA